MTSGLGVGSFVAVYGSIDPDTGGIANASVVNASDAGFDSGASYLTGIVDSVDRGMGVAMVSGKAVSYTALLANGVAPSVGDMVSITGRDYGDSGLLVADPQLQLEAR
jgi:hypothetical protein